MKIHLNSALGSLAVVGMLAGTAACSEDVVPPEQPKENTIPGQEVGIRELKVSVPRLSRFDRVVDRFSCRIHLRGRRDRVEYPVNIFLSADKDSLYMEADDPILVELPHQMYHLNVITFTGKNITSRGEDDGMVREDTVYVGARLDIQDPNNIHFGSSFNVGANSIGSGTEDDPYIIASGDDFMTRIADPMTRGETHEGKFFEMTRNINLNTAAVAYGKGWEPAGHNNINGGSTDFNGTLDGCDNYIENLYCFTDAGCGGLFYSLGEHAYIHNLEMKRVMLNGNSDIGAIACHSKNGCRLDSIEVSGTIEGRQNLGGFIGSGIADFKVCISSIDITSTYSGREGYIGGYIGKASGTSGAASFVNCLRTGRVEAPQAERVGGYIGGYSSQTMTVYNRCYVSGVISGKAYVGGFAGSDAADVTDCHAGATLPHDSYAYSNIWDIFGINNRMTPMPLEVEGPDGYTGGLFGSSTLTLHGENSFAYSSPAKPNIVTAGSASCPGNTGALAGSAYFKSASGASFTSYAYVQGTSCTGGIVGNCTFERESDGTFINYGNVLSTNNGREFGNSSDTGGVFGVVSSATGYSIKGRYKNTGNVQGVSRVGGVFGDACENIDGAVIENDGNVAASGEVVGGLFGRSNSFILGDGSHLSSENGSLKITGIARVGGIVGFMYPDPNHPTVYCPAYANIVSAGEEFGRIGGIAGEVQWSNYVRNKTCQVFGGHAPVRFSITVNVGDNVGGAIGWVNAYAYSGDYPGTMLIDGFDDRLQVSITTNGNIAGGIVGRVETDDIKVQLENCHSFTAINSNASGTVSGFGGILGWLDNGTPGSSRFNILKCSHHGSLSGASMTAAGGIVGYAGDGISVSRCYNAGRVDAVQAVGGIVGRLSGAGWISDCFNMGEVPSGSGREWLAGIIGQKEDSNSSTVNIDDCYNVGTTGWGIIGGEKKSHYSIDDCYYLNSASNGDMKNSGSKSKNADEMRRKSTYNGWLTSYWEFHEGTAAPTLVDVPMFNKKLPLQK